MRVRKKTGGRKEREETEMREKGKKEGCGAAKNPGQFYRTAVR